jgi:O-antigen/teichoic acid export membrane protein
VQTSGARASTTAAMSRFVDTLPAGRLLKNVSANLVGGGWNGLLIVLATPWFVSLLTLEGYGLIAFWLVMQMMMSLFDLGLATTMVREFADSRPGEDADERRRDILRTFECVYWLIASLLTVGLVLSSTFIAGRWLKLHALSASDVATAMKWIATALGLQFPGTLYSAGFAGLQRQGRMNLLQMLGNTARYGGGVGVLLWRPDPVWFFGFQAFVAGAQTAVTRIVLWHMIRNRPSRRPAFSVRLIQGVWRYSAGMAFSTVGALLVANVDRLLLSKFMSAEELGKYSLAFTATGLLQMGIQPFYRAYFPRFAELSALGDVAKLRREYFQGCRLVAGIVIPCALIGLVFAPELFTAWVGAADATVIGAFRWLLLGIACSGVMWLPAAFQQAQGWTRLHAQMIAGALVVGIPVMLWAMNEFGTAGAAAIWVLHGVSGITIELRLMHRRLLIGELASWYRLVLLPPLISTALLVAISRWAMPIDFGRWRSLGWIAATGLVAVACSLLVTSYLSGESSLDLYPIAPQ